MSAFVSHPSVRVKGTENNYEPANCISPKCTKTWPHMHCPFCVKTDTFQDPVILKAHYRVKHVDKGIEFAGLKILRCCEQCDIVGTIKGMKDFKGAHWHCYKCRNGFTRRDEAIKHYRTHFRNPATTFQIQVAQELNQAGQEFTAREVTSAVDGLPQEMTFVETVVTTGGIDGLGMEEQVTVPEILAPTEEPEKPASGEIQVSVAANETVGTCEGQTIMIVPSMQQTDSGDILQGMEAGTAPDLRAIVRTPKLAMTRTVLDPGFSPGTHWRKEKLQLEQEVRELRAKVTQLVTERAHIEHHLKEEISNLKAQLQMTEADVVTYQKRESELLSQLKVPMEDRLSGLLDEMRQQHEELLSQQLTQLRHAYIQHQLTEEFEKSNQAEAQLESDEHQNAEVSEIMCSVNDSSSNVVLDSEVYRSLPGATICDGNVVLSSRSLMAEASHTQLFVVPETLQVKSEGLQHGDHNAELEQEFEEVAVPTSPQLDYDPGDEDSQSGNVDLGHKIILLHPNPDESSSIEYSEKVDIQITLGEMDSEEMHVDSQDSLSLQETNKRKLDFDDHSTAKHCKQL